MKYRSGLVVLTLAVATVLTGCSFFASSSESVGGQSEAAATGWPQEIKDQFMTTCSAQTHGEDALCECGMGILEEKYTAEEILKEEENLKNGTSQILTEIQPELILNCADKLK